MGSISAAGTHVCNWVKLFLGCWACWAVVAFGCWAGAVVGLVGYWANGWAGFLSCWAVGLLGWAVGLALLGWLGLGFRV